MNYDEKKKIADEYLWKKYSTSWDVLSDTNSLLDCDTKEEIAHAAQVRYLFDIGFMAKKAEEQNIGEKLVKYDTAKLAMEKGFNVPVQSFYMNDKELRNYPYHFIDDVLYCYNPEEYSEKERSILTRLDEIGDNALIAPTQSLLQKWLRERHNLTVCTLKTHIKGKGVGFMWYVFEEDVDCEDELFSSWEKALEVGLIEALKLVEP